MIHRFVFNVSYANLNLILNCKPMDGFTPLKMFLFDYNNFKHFKFNLYVNIISNLLIFHF